MKNSLCSQIFHHYNDIIEKVLWMVGEKARVLWLTSRCRACNMNDVVPQNDTITCQCQGAIPKDSLVAKLENISRGAKLNIIKKKKLFRTYPKPKQLNNV